MAVTEPNASETVNSGELGHVAHTRRLAKLANQAKAEINGRLSDEALSSAILGVAAPRAGLSVKDTAFGAVGDGVADDGDAIQAAINAARDAVRAGFARGAGMAFLPGGRYRVTSRIIQPPYVKVVPLGPVVILADVPAESAWHITPLADDPTNLYSGVLTKQQWLTGDLIDGSHGGLTFVNVSGSVGTTRALELGSRTDLTANRPLARYTLRQIAIQGFQEGIRWNSYNHYIAHYESIKIELCDIPLHIVGPGTNSGENIAFHKSIFATTNGPNPAIKIDAPNIDIDFDKCSADFVGSVFEITQGYGSVHWAGGHIENVNEGTRNSATGGIVYSTVDNASQALPTVTIGPARPFVSSRRQTQFKGQMYLSLDMGYRVQGGDYSVNQQPENAFLCDASVRLVKHSLILTRGGSLPQLKATEFRDASLTVDAVGTDASALTHWARTTNGTITAATASDAPLAGYNSLKVTLSGSSLVRLTPKAFGSCRPGDVIYATFAYKFTGAPTPAMSVLVSWFDSEKVQIGSTIETPMSRTTVTYGEWRMPDGPAFLEPPAGAVFYKVGYQISHPTGTGTVDYWFGLPLAIKRSR